ncbi:hypothetical phage protein [Burkholderia cenocepacia J2315]|uniref:Hypothetical phage protein n=1 Tax=Burkholderia cenocepacia (strain ATCC BAA-245 / DSM 16553 / LMG 16656 / NCTC 13227 / J2315 / CF5610) TaxID=216591 RepID=B4ENU0_BURCJ|nr:hypothetical phage protein [Burkholderia cenocepacia J2315]
MATSSAETTQRLRKAYAVDAALFLQVADKSKHRLPDSVHTCR